MTRVNALSMVDPLNPQVVMSIDTEYELEPRNVLTIGDTFHIFSDGAVLSYAGIQSRKPTKTGERLWSQRIDGKRVIVHDEQLYMSGLYLSRGVIENGALEVKASLMKEDFTQEGSEDIVVTDDYLYNIRTYSGLEVVDYKNMPNLTVVTEIDMRHAQRMLRSGNYLYLIGTSRLESVSNDEVGLQIVDISQPAAPRYVKSIPIPGMEEDIVEWNGKLYVGGTGALHTFDKSDPENPRLVHSLDLTGLGGNSPGIDGAVSSITVRPDGIAYVSLVCQGWIILDLRGSSPALVKKL
ncbi:hypothetical protein [Oligoflexus tunisiensis]|uniref:hypothetical protein n=1 Tax=Oligoflexus tunisiensis TaxID=708132 RepID=UPI00159F07D0|nr:hypothetical protein [Oligoflexus tunisiensis]